MDKENAITIISSDTLQMATLYYYVVFSALFRLRSVNRYPILAAILSKLEKIKTTS